jgi:transglutaminase-like putative cysteine protease
MSRARVGAGTGVAVAAAVTTWVTLWSWGGFVEVNGDYLFPLIPGLALVVGAGIAARTARLPAVVVIAGQLLVTMLYANLLWGSALLPTPDSVREAVVEFARAVETAQQYQAPIPASAPSAAPLLVLGGLACYLIVDACGVTFARVPVAGLPLLTIYSLPISVLDRSVNWLVFVFSATGFLVMLLQQESDRLARWGRTLDGGEADRSGFNVRNGRHGTVAVGASAISLALFVPVLVPTFHLDLFDTLGRGTGGNGNREVRITNPLADLKRDLVQGEDRPLLQIHTTGPAPSYVRLSVLTAYTGITWSPGNRELPDDQVADGEMPFPIGLSPTIPRTEDEWEVRVDDNLDSQWLPTALYLAAVRANDDWRYDARTLDVRARTDDISTRGLEYSLTAIDPEFGPDDLVTAGAAPFAILTPFTDLPARFPVSVRKLALDVTQGLFNDFLKAVALQQFFQRNFRYSTARDPGNGNNELEEFLAPGDRSGYCEQFAAAMAVMARALDIPARVSVGFLNADLVAEDTYEFSSRDMHAWPEVYLDGYGWVRFEPTPTRHTGSVPPYTSGVRPEPNQTDLPTSQPSDDLPSRSQATASATDDPTADNQKDSGQDDGLSPAPFLWTGGGLALVGLLLLVPRVVRRRRTTRRWSSPAEPAEAAWAELRDSAADLGVPWPHGRSPRAGAARLAQSLAAPLTPGSPERPQRGPQTNPEAAAALDLIVEGLELARYAPSGQEAADPAGMRAAADTCVEGLRAGVGGRARWRAAWWPRSVLDRRPGTARRTASPLPPRQGVVDNLEGADVAVIE